VTGIGMTALDAGKSLIKHGIENAIIDSISNNLLPDIDKNDYIM